MKLRGRDHLVQPWRIHEVAAGFEIEDVWALHTPGGPDDFRRLVDQLWTSFDRSPGGVGRIIWAARWRLGAWLGWDRPSQGLGSRVTPLRERLPADLAPFVSDVQAAAGLPFSPIYQLPREWAAELANATVHGIVHLGWVDDGHQQFRGQLAVLVRPNGWRGQVYMAAIKPFRGLIYPAWIRRIEERWALATAHDGQGGIDR